MPRRPNPKSKTPRIVIEAKSEDELKKLQGLRQVFSREEPGTMRKELWEAITHVLAKHHWPPGNPQTQIPKYVEKHLVQERKCQHPRCKETATYECVPESKYAQSKVLLCQKHFRHAEQNGLLKGFWPIKK